MLVLVNEILISVSAIGPILVTQNDQKQRDIQNSK